MIDWEKFGAKIKKWLSSIWSKIVACSISYLLILWILKCFFSDRKVFGDFNNLSLFGSFIGGTGTTFLSLITLVIAYDAFHQANKNLEIAADANKITLAHKNYDIVLSVVGDISKTFDNNYQIVFNTLSNELNGLFPGKPSGYWRDPFDPINPDPMTKEGLAAIIYSKREAIVSFTLLLERLSFFLESEMFLGLEPLFQASIALKASTITRSIALENLKSRMSSGLFNQLVSDGVDVGDASVYYGVLFDDKYQSELDNLRVDFITQFDKANRLIKSILEISTKDN